MVNYDSICQGRTIYQTTPAVNTECDNIYEEYKSAEMTVYNRNRGRWEDV